MDFFWPAAINPGGGFFQLDHHGAPRTGEGVAVGLPLVTRMVHCAAIGHLLGRPLAAQVLDHGIASISKQYRDPKHGGYFWSVYSDGVADTSKQAYGHAFVLLAAASAKTAGHPEAEQLLDDITTLIGERFWDTEFGAMQEEFQADWTPLSDYRGQNANMHLAEAAMAAFEATGETSYLDIARSVAQLLINTHARHADWRVPEHFDADWVVNYSYSGNPDLRPAGTTPGHSLEWARLLLQLWGLCGRSDSWMPDAATALFRKACATGWDNAVGGFYYTLDWTDRTAVADRYWWPACEGIAAAHVLSEITSDPEFELWYRRIWAFTDRHFIDRRSGGWQPELGIDLLPAKNKFDSKSDLYHALQACLIPLFEGQTSFMSQIASNAGPLQQDRTARIL